jgi:hypothetical protein
MSDWDTICRNFNSLQDTNKLYPSQCDRETSTKSTEQILDLISQISKFKGELDRGGDTYINQNLSNLSNSVKSNVQSFCCVLNARKTAQQQLQDAKDEYAIAEARVKSVRKPESDISFFGTRVPFGRPLRTDSVPILLAVSISFIILSLGMILNLSSIQLAYKAPPGDGLSLFFQNLYISYQQTSWLVLAITVVLSAGAAGGIYYAIQKTRPEWLGLKPI